MTGEYSVYVVFPNEDYSRELSFVDAKTAVEKARSLTKTVGARLGTTRQVMITDGDDCCVFLWRFGVGIVYPTPEERRASIEEERKPS